MKKNTVLTAILAASAVLISNPVGFTYAQKQTTTQNQSGNRAVAGGAYRGLRWTVYAPGNLTLKQTYGNALIVEPPASAKLLGTKWDGRNIVISFRSQDNMQTVFRHFSQQLLDQGWKRDSADGHLPDFSNNPGNVNDKYARGNDIVELKLNREDQNRYRVLFDLEQVAANNNAAMNGGANNTAANNANNNAAANNAAGNTTSGTNAGAATSNGTTMSNGTAANNGTANNNANNAASSNAANNAAGSDDDAKEGGNMQGKPVVNDLGKLRVTVLPAGSTRPSNSSQANTFYLMPPKDATKSTVNFTGDVLFLGYYTQSNLQQNFDFIDQQIRAQGFTLKAKSSNATPAGASDGELKGTYTRGEAQIDVSVNGYGDGGYRVVADLTGYAKTLNDNGTNGNGNNGTNGNNGSAK